MFSFLKKKSQTETQDDINPEVARQVKQIEAMKDRIAQLEAIKSAMPDPYYARDMEYNVTIWSESCARLTGFSEREALGKKCYDIFKTCVCPPHQKHCPIQLGLKDRNFLKNAEVVIYNKSGKPIPTLVSNAGIYNEKGEPIGTVEIVRDNTAVKNIMESVSQMAKRIGTVSSELNNATEKINGISGEVYEGAYKAVESIHSGVQAGKDMNEKVAYSNSHAADVQGTMSAINESMKFSLSKTVELKEKSEMIIKVLSMIQEIASKTNLLAINASIEAAHAGESGRGFKVVADGIRELSKNSSDSAALIKKTIDEIIGLVQETTKSLNITEKDIQKGTGNITEILTFVSDIGNATQALMDMLTAIESAAKGTTVLTEEQNASVKEVSAVCGELTEIASNLTQEFEKAFKAATYSNM